MDNNTTKIKLVFVPYLIISLAILFGWTFLHWLLFIKLNICEGKEGVLVIIIPLVLSATSLFIWFRKKLDVLKLPIITKETYGDKFIYCLVPTIAIVGTSFFAQQYIELTTANVIQLSSISQIKQKEPARFYSLKNFYLDKKNFSIKKQFSHATKSTALDMCLYIAVPILNSAKDTLRSNCMGWYGLQYLDLHIDTIEKPKEVEKFVNESLMKFDKLNLNHFLYLNRINESGDYDSYVLANKNDHQGFNRQFTGDYENYILAIKNNTKYNNKSDVVLLPANESLADRANDNLIIALSVFGGGSLLFLIMVTSPKLKSEEEG